MRLLKNYVKGGLLSESDLVIIGNEWRIKYYYFHIIPDIDKNLDINGNSISTTMRIFLGSLEDSRIFLGMLLSRGFRVKDYSHSNCGERRFSYEEINNLWSFDWSREVYVIEVRIAEKTKKFLEIIRELREKHNYRTLYCYRDGEDNCLGFVIY